MGPWGSRMLALAFVLLLAGAVPVPWAAAQEMAERGFFGVQGWRHPGDDDLRSLQRGGIGSLRAGFNRAAVVGRRGALDWRELDSLISGAARAGIEVVPVLSNAPFVDDRHRARPPRTRSARRAWARWVEEAVARYGHAGSYWIKHPRVPYVPVTAWQVWNEPNLRAHWPKPDARAYTTLLRATSAAIRRIDPDATVVLAGIPDTLRGVRLAPYLRRLYRQRGFKRLFDVMALHPYEREINGVEDRIETTRRVMRRHGDRRRRIWITEIGWATAGPRRARFRVSLRGQAARLRDAYEMFLEERSRWRLERVFWFSLRDRDLGDLEGDWFGPHTGLFYRSGLAKPAWAELATVAGGRADEWLGGESRSGEEDAPCGVVFC